MPVRAGYGGASAGSGARFQRVLTASVTAPIDSKLRFNDLLELLEYKKGRQNASSAGNKPSRPQKPDPIALQIEAARQVLLGHRDEALRRGYSDVATGIEEAAESDIFPIPGKRAVSQLIFLMPKALKKTASNAELNDIAQTIASALLRKLTVTFIKVEKEVKNEKTGELVTVQVDKRVDGYNNPMYGEMEVNAKGNLVLTGKAMFIQGIIRNVLGALGLPNDKLFSVGRGGHRSALLDAVAAHFEIVKEEIRDKYEAVIAAMAESIKKVIEGLFKRAKASLPANRLRELEGAKADKFAQLDEAVASLRQKPPGKMALAYEREMRRPLAQFSGYPYDAFPPAVRKHLQAAKDSLFDLQRLDQRYAKLHSAHEEFKKKMKRIKAAKFDNKVPLAEELKLSFPANFGKPRTAATRKKIAADLTSIATTNVSKNNDLLNYVSEFATQRLLKNL